MNESNSKQIFDLELTSVADFPDFTDSFFTGEEKFQPEGEKFIVFILNDIQYGISSSGVSEVVRQLKLTTLPNIPGWVLGIANLRGDIVSVIDLQKLWKQESTPYTSKSKLIVIRDEENDSLIALKVDRLREIVTLSSDSIAPADKYEDPFLSGLAEHKAEPIKLLDMEKILSSLKLD
jgi:purine-binding chemotaxis protein CheW